MSRQESIDRIIDKIILENEKIEEASNPIFSSVTTLEDVKNSIIKDINKKIFKFYEDLSKFHTLDKKFKDENSIRKLASVENLKSLPIKNSGNYNEILISYEWGILKLSVCNRVLIDGDKITNNFFIKKDFVTNKEVGLFINSKISDDLYQKSLELIRNHF